MDCRSARRLKLRHLESLEIEPAIVVLDRVPADIPIRATATFDDGTCRDVTHLATFTPLDKSAVEVDRDGTIHVARPGRQVVMLRFASRAVPFTITSPLGDYAATDWPAEARQDGSMTKSSPGSPNYDSRSRHRPPSTHLYEGCIST